ncbi:type II secretion system protein GspM [Achromobacter xylosoxidans]
MNLIDKLHASWRASQQRYAPAVHRARQGWQALAPRERRLVQCAGAVLGAALVWTLLIEPPLKTLNQYRDELPKLRAQAAQVADLTAQADLLRRRAPPPPAPCPPPRSWPPAWPARACLPSNGSWSAKANPRAGPDRASSAVVGADELARRRQPRLGPDGGWRGTGARRQSPWPSAAGPGQRPRHARARRRTGVLMALPRPSRRGLLLALACSVAALLAALSALPARWLLLAAPQGGIVSLADASGTVWNGSAWIALGPPGARRVLPQALQWQWHWRTLEMELRHPWLQGPLRLSPGWTGATLSAQSLRAPTPRCRRWARPGTRWRRKARWNSSGRRCR